MSKTRRCKTLMLISMLVLLSLLNSCKKNDPVVTPAGDRMQDLKVPASFDWETSRTITFRIIAEYSTVVNITSESGDISYFRGYHNGIGEWLEMDVNIPAYVTSVKVNGNLAALTGPVVSVDLTGSAADAPAFKPLSIPLSGLLAAWHFDENQGTVASDAVGGHHGTITGAQWTSGIKGSALHFDGTGNQVQVPNSGFNPTGSAISFSFWFRLDNVGDNGAFIFQNVKYILKMDAQGRIGFALYTPVYKSVTMNYADRILDTDWHHGVATYDGSEMKIYVDGNLKVTGANTGNLQSTTSDVYIGYQKTLNPFKGIIDEMLVYDRALTQQEVEQILVSTPDPGTGEADMISWWKLDENGGTVAADSKDGNDGFITNATWGTGIAGSCLVFDGTAGLVTAPNKPNLNPVTGITMMAWAKTRENKTCKIFQKGDWDGHGIGQGKWDGWQVHVRMADNTSQSIHWGGGLPILNEWYHLAMTYDGQQLKFYVNGQLRNSKPVTGVLKVNGRDLSIGSDNGAQKYFNGSIDDLKFFGRALDITEIQANFEQTGTSSDQDGDGIPDTDDSYPKDPARAFDNFHPASGYATLAFEDLWPGKGDYDFNDLVLDYRFRIITDAGNKVTEIAATFVIRAIGAGLRNGFGFQLPDGTVSQADMEAAGIKLTEEYIVLDPNGLESGQERPTVIVYDNVSNIMPSPGGFGVNVQPGAPYVDPDTTVVSMLFKPGSYSINAIAIDRFNPFLIVDMDRGKEIHLPDHAPTSLVNPAWFKTSEDDSDPASGRYYKTTTNLPWAIRIASDFDYTVESAQITSAYLKFAPWAESGGNAFPDWYLDTPGYRNNANIYQK